MDQEMSTALRIPSSSSAKTPEPNNSNSTPSHDATQPTSTSSSSSTTTAATLTRLLLGQLLALCIALTGVFSSLLATKNSSVALLQSCTAYALIFILCGPIHYKFSSQEHEFEMVHQRVLKMNAKNQSNNKNNNGDNSSSSQQQESTTTSPIDDVTCSSTITPSKQEDDENMNLIDSNNNNNTSSTKILDVGIRGYFHSHFPIWRYFALACCDVGANFFAIKAYSYTDITSAQLLDAATIFTVMILGYIFLRRRFNFRHGIGILFALSGMVGLVFLDATDKSRDSEKTAPDAVLGDALTLIASVLYGVTNVSCESLLKAGRVHFPTWCPVCVKDGTNVSEEQETNDENQNQQEQTQGSTTNKNGDDEGTTQTVRESFHLIIEYATYISLFGFFLSFILMLATAIDEVKSASSNWDWKATMFQAAFCCVMVATYVGLPSLLKLTNATFAALSLLTADAYAVVLNYVTTGVAPKGLYYLCAAVILFGVLVFDTAENTNSRTTTITTASGSSGGGGDEEQEEGHS